MVWVTGAGAVSVVVVVDCVASCAATGSVNASTASDTKAAVTNFLDFNRFSLGCPEWEP